MTMHPKQSAGFSLVEVVLAVGIVGFSLLSIFSLFSVSLQTNSATIAQVEALSAVKALPALLQSVQDTSTPPNQGFITVYNWMVNANNPVPVTTTTATASAPLLYAYNYPTTAGTPAPGATGQTGQSTVAAVPVPVNSSTQTLVSQAAAGRQGRLYGIYLSVSPNTPVGRTAYPTSSTLATYSPGPTSATYPEGALALQVKVYVVSQVGTLPPSGAVPVLTYDLTLPR